MSRLMGVFLIGLMCGAMIVGALAMRDRAAPVQAAGQWQTKVFPEGFVVAGDNVPAEPDLYVDHFLKTLGASCVIELSGDDASPLRGNEPGVLFYACP